MDCSYLVSLIASNDCLAPFIQPKPSSLCDAIGRVKRLQPTPETIEHVRAAGQKVVRFQSDATKQHGEYIGSQQ